MTPQRPIILASGSQVRAAMLCAAGLQITVQPAKVDEALIRASLLAEGAKPHDLADALAEMKAARVAARNPDALVLGCDQALDFQGSILSKPETADQARAQLLSLRGKAHRLLSAIVLYDAGRPVWRHIGTATLTMRDFSDDYLAEYLERNWPAISESVGSYLLEDEGIRLFSDIDGDYFTILGLPLLALLNQLALRKDIMT